MCVTASFLPGRILGPGLFAAAKETFQLLSLGLPLQWPLTFIKKLDSEEDTHARLLRTAVSTEVIGSRANPGRFWKPTSFGRIGGKPSSGLTRECFAAPSLAIRPEQ